MDVNLFLNKFYKDFQEYTFKNQVLIAASGFAIGFATNNLLSSLMSDIVEPFIIYIAKIVTSFSPLVKTHPYLWALIRAIVQIIWLFTVWIIIILLSFFVIEYVLNRKILGFTSAISSPTEKQDYIKTKLESKTKNNILPTKSDEIEIMKEQHLLDSV